LWLVSTNHENKHIKDENTATKNESITWTVLHEF
jgi:hypothetical protein